MVDPCSCLAQAGPAAAAMTVEEITDDEDESDEENEGNDGDGATGQDPERSPMGLASPALEGESPVGLDSLDIDCERNLPFRKCREVHGDDKPIDRSYKIGRAHV